MFSTEDVMLLKATPCAGSRYGLLDFSDYALRQLHERHLKLPFLLEPMAIRSAMVRNHAGNVNGYGAEGTVFTICK
jgi:hypothetical protein